MSCLSRSRSSREPTPVRGAEDPGARGGGLMSRPRPSDIVLIRPTHKTPMKSPRPSPPKCMHASELSSGSRYGSGTRMPPTAMRASGKCVASSVTFQSCIRCRFHIFSQSRCSLGVRFLPPAWSSIFSHASARHCRVPPTLITPHLTLRLRCGLTAVPLEPAVAQPTTRPSVTDSSHSTAASDQVSAV